MRSEERQRSPNLAPEAVPFLDAGPLGPFIAGKTVRQVGPAHDEVPAEPVDVVLSYCRLQDMADYRSALQGWFESVGTGGHLIVVVPHAFLYERQLGLPSPWRAEQRRLYTPGSLLQEIEEALVPNSYRVRWAGDLDQGYDYALSPTFEPQGRSDAAVVLEKIAPPAWDLGPHPSSMAAPKTADFTFEPVRTRVELNAFLPVKRLLVLKLDHVGDFIMALPALERLRSYFADSEFTLVVGSWNVDMARELGLADKVIGFDAFPRNSTEEEPNVVATLGQFRSLITDHYDVAVDLRTDTDTRVLLQAVSSTFKAGIGRRAQFPFLDIALPLDSTRNEAERAQEDHIAPLRFESQGSARRTPFAIHSDKHTVERDCAIIWGPYFELRPGDYIFDFYIDLDPDRADGVLGLDIAVNRGQTIAKMLVSEPGKYQLPFRIEQSPTTFEARVYVIDDRPSLSFSFYGGRLIRRGAESVLHQSEYSTLMVELLKLRLQEFGIVRDAELP